MPLTLTDITALKKAMKDRGFPVSEGPVLNDEDHKHYNVFALQYLGLAPNQISHSLFAPPQSLIDLLAAAGEAGEEVAPQGGEPESTEPPADEPPMAPNEPVNVETGDEGTNGEGTENGEDGQGSDGGEGTGSTENGADGNGSEGSADNSGTDEGAGTDGGESGEGSEDHAEA